jgi:SAM-dependent methyltransferase
MTAVFALDYAALYDNLYAEKDYEGEVETLVRLFGRWATRPVMTVLDLGCGTGRHAIPLARRGLRVTGVDRSPDMLRHATSNAADANVSHRVQLLSGDLRSFRLGQKFDAALLMFAVLGYQIGNADVLSALRSARSHLYDGGLLVLDAWSGIAVLREGPSERVKTVLRGDRSFRRIAKATLDAPTHTCEVHYTLSRDDEPEQIVAEEWHLVRYFFPLELALFLESADFEVLRVGSFPDIDRDLKDDTWNLMVVARAGARAGTESGWAAGKREPRE